MSYRIVRNSSERKDGEICIDLIDGFLAPSWQARNLLKYSVASPKIKEGSGIVLYKKELLLFWKGTRAYPNDEDAKQAEKARELLNKIINEGSEVCLATGSGGPTPYSEVFEKFLGYIRG